MVRNAADTDFICNKPGGQKANEWRTPRANTSQVLGLFEGGGMIWERFRTFCDVVRLLLETCATL